MEKCVITFDVGGTSIKAGIVDQGLNIIGNEIKSYPAMSEETEDTIIDNIINIFRDQCKRLGDSGYKIEGLAFGFPGPFDYQKGISYIKGLGKYDELYGVHLHEKLSKRLLTAQSEYVIKFQNDALAFAQGEYCRGKGMGFDKIIVITLGTGCGSTFLNCGCVVAGEMGVPEEGVIFDEPYRDSIVDEYISRRGILNIAAQKGFDIETLDVQELVFMAREGDLLAKEVFEEFGCMLAEVLNPYITKFMPDTVILGGRIAQAYDMFKGSMNENLVNKKVFFQVSENLSGSALIGAASAIFRK